MSPKCSAEIKPEKHEIKLLYAKFSYLNTDSDSVAK